MVVSIFYVRFNSVKSKFAVIKTAGVGGSPVWGSQLITSILKWRPLWCMVASSRVEGLEKEERGEGGGGMGKGMA